MEAVLRHKICTHSLGHFGFSKEPILHTALVVSFGPFLEGIVLSEGLWPEVRTSLMAKMQTMPEIKKLVEHLQFANATELVIGNM